MRLQREWGSNSTPGEKLRRTVQIQPAAQDQTQAFNSSFCKQAALHGQHSPDRRSTARPVARKLGEHPGSCFLAFLQVLPPPLLQHAHQSGQHNVCPLLPDRCTAGRGGAGASSRGGSGGCHDCLLTHAVLQMGRTVATS